MRKLLLGLIGLLFAVPAVATTLPAGYTELEYIESTGTQYIDTGIYLASNMVVVVKAEQTGTSGNIFGYTQGNSGRWMFSLNTTASTASLYSDNTKAVGSFSSMPVEITCNMGTGITVNGITTNFTESATRTAPDTAWLFKAQGSSMTPSGRIYYFKIYQNNNLIMNLVPAKNSSGVIGMYDLVSEQFFTNQGTGEFIAGPEVSIRIATTAYNSARFSPVVTELNDTIATIRSVVTNTINQTKAIADLQATKQTRPDETCPAGKKCLLVEDDAGQPHWYEIIESASRLPDGYTELEYVEATSSGPGFKDNLVIKNTQRIEIDLNISGNESGQAWIAGHGASTWPEQTTMRYNSGTKLVLQAGGSSATELNSPNTRNARTLYTLDILNKKSYVNGVQVLDFTGYAFSPARTDTWGYMCYSTGADNTLTGCSKGKLYSIKVYDNNVLVRNFIPAKRNSDNVVGMYDLVSGQFLTNQGTGTFVEGPEI